MDGDAEADRARRDGIQRPRPRGDAEEDRRGSPRIRSRQSLWNAGSSAEGLSLYEPAKSEFAEILNISTDADDCGQHEKCFTYESTLAYDEASNPKAFDLKLAVKGTYRNRAGRIVAVPAAPFVLRFADGKYAPVLTTAAMRAAWEAMQSPW